MHCFFIDSFTWIAVSGFIEVAVGLFYLFIIPVKMILINYPKQLNQFLSLK